MELKWKGDEFTQNANIGGGLAFDVWSEEDDEWCAALVRPKIDGDCLHLCKPLKTMAAAKKRCQKVYDGLVDHACYRAPVRNRE